VAEAAGLDAVWLAEHHFVPYGTCPSAVLTPRRPASATAAAVRRTRWRGR
ncbi:LLM class flavin-dependent oxidoreductase, partial [Streptomyces sp. NPDC096934]